MTLPPYATAPERRRPQPWLRGRWYGWLSGGLCAIVLAWQPAAAEQLVIDYVISNSAQRSAWLAIVDQFAAANPDIEIINNGFPQEQYKRDVQARLRTGHADLAFWYAGERLRDAASHGLLAPLDAAMLTRLAGRKFLPGTLDGTRIDDKVYGFPLYYYAWGFVYRKSLFQQLALQPPTTWAEFLQVCARLKAAGVMPLGLGARSGWPAAAWFDYLNLRLHGIEFHRKLLRGDIAFTDARVRRVLDTWGDLLRRDYFFTPTLDQEYDRVLPYVYRNRVGMTLAGSFVAARFPAAIAADMGFFSFPTLTPGMPVYEEAPLDVLVLPARGRHPAARDRFLAFLADGDALRRIAEADQTLAPFAGPVSPTVQLGAATAAIWNAAAGHTYFFDRDARAALVPPAYDALRGFLQPPYDTDRTVRQLEAARLQLRQAPGQ